MPLPPRVQTAAFALAALLLLGGLAAATLREAPEAASGAVRVVVTGPGAEPIHDGTVDVENGTALDALLAAADAGGFAVETRAYSYGTYVVSIAGHRASGASGWIYAVERGGERRPADRAADLMPVGEGDTVRWTWTDGSQGV